MKSGPAVDLYRTMQMENEQKTPLSFRISRIGGAMAIIGAAFSVSISQLGLFLAVISWIIYQRKQNLQPDSSAGHWSMPFLFPLPLKFAFAAYLIILFSGLLDLFYTDDIIYRLDRIFNGEFNDVLLLPAALWVLAYSSDERGKKDLYRWFSISGILVILSGLSLFSKYRLSKILHHLQHGWEAGPDARYQHHVGTLFSGSDYQLHLYMPVGFMGTHLTYAAVLGFFFLVLFFRMSDLFFTSPRRLFETKNLLQLSGLFLSIIILILNNGRSAILGILGVALIGLYYFWRTGWGKRIWRLVPIAGLFFLALFALYAGSDRFHNRFQEMIGSFFGQEKHTDYQRTFVWHATLRMMKENPVLGVGSGGYVDTVNRHVIEISQEKPRLWYAYALIQRGHAHNDLFHMLAVGGPLALLFYLLFFGSYFYWILKPSASRDEDFWKWSPLLILIGGLFQCYYLDDSVLMPFWVLVGLGLRGIIDGEEKRRNI